jgi:hypothetical protein
MTNKHRHAEMIKAKADNMDLVVFTKDCIDTENPWFAIEANHLPCFDEHAEYFMSLPQTAKECLHWLNGGDAQYKCADGDWWLIDSASREDNLAWSDRHIFMHNDVEIRIKPKKEKRWIIVDGKHEVCLPKVFRRREETIYYYGSCLYQVIEIEIEV